MDEKLLKRQWCGHSSIGEYQHRAVYSDVTYIVCPYQSQNKQGVLLSSLVEAIAFQRIEEHDIDTVSRV